MSDIVESHCVQMPNDLDAHGQEAYHAIMKVLLKNQATYTGGCKAFRSPAEWKARGEEYGCNSKLIVVYDGGDHGAYFSLDRSCPGYLEIEEMNTALQAIGMYSEECTGWYAAVYLARKSHVDTRDFTEIV